MGGEKIGREMEMGEGYRRAVGLLFCLFSGRQRNAFQFNKYELECPPKS